MMAGGSDSASVDMKAVIVSQLVANLQRCYSPKFLILENLDKFLTLLQFVSAWFIQVIKIIGSILYLGTYFGKFGVIQWFSKAHRSKLPKVNPKWRQNKQTRI